MHKNLIIAHRGIHDNITTPENSISSFKKAIDKNLPIEFDIQLTKDNKLVIFHDDNLKRMTGVDKFIQEMNFDEVRKLKLLNTNESIPTFKEVLDLVNKKVLLDIEIKNTNKKKQVVELVLKELENYKGEVYLKSFNPIIVKQIKKKTDKYKLGLLITDKYNINIVDFIFKTNLPIYYLKPDFLAIKKTMLTKKYYKHFKDHYNIFIWTIKTEKEMQKYNKTYLDNISYICNIEK